MPVSIQGIRQLAYRICPAWFVYCYTGLLCRRQVLELPALVSVSRELGWLCLMFAWFRCCVCWHEEQKLEGHIGRAEGSGKEKDLSKCAGMGRAWWIICFGGTSMRPRDKRWRCVNNWEVAFKKEQKRQPQIHAFPFKLHKLRPKPDMWPEILQPASWLRLGFKPCLVSPQSSDPKFCLDHVCYKVSRSSLELGRKLSLLSPSEGFQWKWNCCLNI